MVEVANPEPVERRAGRYQRTRRRLGIVRFALNAAYLLGLLFAGWSVALRNAAWSWTENVWLAVALYMLLLGGISRLISLPLSFYSGYVLEHRYELSNLRLGGWLRDLLKSIALGAAFGIVAVEILYWTLRSYPDAWWLLCWAMLALFSILMTHLAPVLLFPLFFKFHSLANEDLRERLLKLSERAGARVRDVMEWKLSAKSKKANAALVGLGNTRRIILADNLVNQYTAEEIEAILAHELAHHVHGDIWKGITLQLSLSLAAFALADQALQRFGPYFGYQGLGDFANLPLLAAVSTVLSLMVLPLVNGFSRQRERKADEFALRMIPDVSPFISSMEKLAEHNLAERRPNRWIEFIFHSHPSIEKRIRRAEAFRGTT